MEYKYSAIILGKRDVAETDRLYFTYTLEAGKVPLLAKGVRKLNARLAPNLETLTIADIFVAKSRGRGNITGVIAEENFLELKKNIICLEKVFAAVKIFNRLLTEEEKDKDIFNLLKAYLSLMNGISPQKESSEKADVLTTGFLFQLFKKLGYEIQAKKCVICLKPLKSGGNFFSGRRGGVVCENCAKKEAQRIKITDEAIKLIRIFLDNRIENFSKIKITEKDIRNAKLVLNEVINWTAG